MDSTSKLNLMNYYLLNKKESICIKDTVDDILGKEVDPNIVLGMAANLDKWGYELDEECLKRLMTLSESSVVSIYNELVKTLKEIKGDEVSHDDFLFKNFPDSCRRVDINTLSTNRFISYYAAFIDDYFGTDFYKTINWDTETPTERTKAVHDNTIIIKLGSEEQFCEMVKNMLSGRMSLSDFDKEIVGFAIENFDAKDIMPKDIPFKENWAYVLKQVFAGKLDYDIKFTTMTDFVRATVALSDGDITLATKPKLRSFKNQERKILLSKLNDAAKRNPEVFKQSLMTQRNRRFVKNILQKGWHLKDNDNKYRYLCNAISECEERYSNISLAEQYLTKNEYLLAAKYYYMSSPGELIRKANMLMSKMPDENKNEFSKLVLKAAQKVAVPVLLNARNALNIESPTKVAFIKGNTAKVHTFENNLKLDEDSRNMLSDIYTKAIKEQMKETPSVGKIYIDENLKDCPVPFNVRTNNGKNRSVERGTKLPMKENKDIIRAFCYKKCKQGGFYDLSATFLNDKFSMVEQVSWTQLKTEGSKPMAVHSGDNPNSKDGCTEFIDIDLNAVKKHMEKIKNKDKKIKYIAFQVHAWNGVPFEDMEKVYFGIMERNAMSSDKITKRDIDILTKNGVNTKLLNYRHDPYYFNLNDEQLKLVKDYKQEEVFDPATVSYKFDLTGKNLVKVPMLFDIEENKFIFTDLDAKTTSPFIKATDIREHESNVPSNIINLYAGDKTPLVENYIGPVANACNAIVNTKKPTLYDLFTEISNDTNTIIVNDIEKADVICSVDRVNTDKKNITPFDTEEITSYYLTPQAKDDKMEEIEDMQK